MDRLDTLEAQSIYILREAYAKFDNLGLLWSLGKDSNVMVWLAKKAFCGHIPFPLLFCDTGKKFPIEGSGKSRRNFIFSYDFCNGIYKTLKHGKIGSTYHFSGKKFHSVLDVIKTVCDLKSFNLNKLVKRIKGRTGQDLLYKLGSLSTQKALKWKPVYSLKKGLNEVINYHKKNFINYTKINLTYKDKNLKK